MHGAEFRDLNSRVRRWADTRPGTKVLHDLRATAATFMLETGASMETLRTNLGWKSREVVERYVKAFAASRDRAVEAVARELM